ncbi:MAG: hypothetical protein A2V65_09825 [Deltaproteobacteria bacterium RBG_13_49_15]|nr:MAG: hypothetical protein A2V65_09825 [Deltaproteobacteria bacterium RBG_13_49_15]
MKPSNRIEVLISIFFIIAIFILYWQSFKHDFVFIDDNAYVTDNPNVKSGLSVHNIKWAFTTFSAEFWHPLTWLSLMVDTQLFGVIPGGYLFTNILLHIFNSIFLFFIFNNMTGAIWRSAFATALFALHPLHVESVAWISMRKDVLSTFFAILTIWSYNRFVNDSKKANYLLTMSFFIAGLMAKPMFVTLPFVLILIDLWPLHRCRLLLRGEKIELSLLLIFWKKIPLFLISAIFVVITYHAQNIGGGIVPLEDLSLSDRIGNAIISYSRYIGKMLWPKDLAFFYPLDLDLPLTYVILSLTLLISMTVLAVMLFRHHSYLIAGWLWYLITLLPVIGIIKIGDFAMADRYTYFPLIGLSIIISWGIPTLTNNWKFSRPLLISSAVLCTISLSFISYRQIGTWKDSTALFKNAISSTERNFLAHWGIAHVLAGEGKMKEAAMHFQKAVLIKPEKPIFHNDLGRTLIVLGEFEEAASSFKQAIKKRPKYTEAYYYQGLAMTALYRYLDAIDSLSKAIQLHQDDQKISKTISCPDIDSLNMKPLTLKNKEEIYHTIGQYEKVLYFNPHCPLARQHLAHLYVILGKYEYALSLFKIKISTDWLKKAAEKGFQRWDLARNSFSQDQSFGKK